jgi:hypothetical protein
VWKSESRSHLQAKATPTPPYDRAWEPGLLVNNQAREPGLLDIVSPLDLISTYLVDTLARGWYHRLENQRMR